MGKRSSQISRIGMVNFINTAPIYEVWQRTVDQAEWMVTEAVPSTLNQLLREGELDLGFISSQEYCAYPEKYKLLRNLSISATGAVGSVFLFARNKISDFSVGRILLSSHSQTSISLLGIILEEFYQISPDYVRDSINNHADNLAGFDGVMAIGDEALKLTADDNFPHKFDLGEIWHEHTGLPFVFAVWAVRDDYYRQSSSTVKKIHRELLRCLTEGVKDLRSICTLVAPRIPMPPEECHKYLSRIEYDLGEDKQKGLQLFFKYLIKRGEGQKEALPLRFVD